MKMKPSAKQLAFLDWEMGFFFHFGIRSFFMGHKDWDGREMPAEAFQPDQLDCEQWIRVAKEAGATYTILTCKHHDGFALWPSAYSNYSVAQSPWKDGKGDVVREYVDACRKYGLKVGLYYSPAQWHGSVPFQNAQAYDDYFIAQISELLSNYGKIDYLWFDGNGSDKHTFDRARIVQAIRALQPDILIFNMWDADTRWCGNEDGYVSIDHSSEAEANAINSLTADGRMLFLPAECDCKLRSTWFDCEENEDTIKTVEALVGMYEMSVGRGANFLLNLGPNCHGLLNEKDVQQVMAMRRELDRRYAQVLPFGEMEADPSVPDSFIVTLPEWSPNFAHETRMENVLVNTVVLEEDLTEGESVQEFCVYAQLPGSRSKRICVYRGYTIGHKAICRFPSVFTGRISVEITAHNGEYRLKNIKAYHT